MSKLKLAPIEDDKPVKLSLEIPAPVHRELIAYGEVLGREAGKAVAPERLIVPMLSRFMATDRAFASQKRRSDEK